MDETNNKDQTRVINIAFIGLTTLIGMQMIRALIPYFLNLLRDRFEIEVIVAALIALLIFATAFLAGPVNRFLGSTPTLIISAIILGFTRLALQLWNYEPLGDMILAATGVIAFLLFLPVALGMARRRGGDATLNMGIGLLAGLILDVAISGAFFSYDLSWQNGWLPALLVITIIVAHWFLISRFVRDGFELDTADAPISNGLTWLFLGPFIFLQLLIFGNFGWAMTTISLSFPIVLVLMLVGLWAGLMLLVLPWRMFRVFSLIFAGIAIFITLRGGNNDVATDLSPAVFLVAGQIGLAGFVLATMRHLGGGQLKGGLRNITIAHGLGFLLLVIFLFGYYAGYDLPLPLDNTIIPLISYGLVILCGLPGFYATTAADFSLSQTTQRFILALLVLLLVPLGQQFFQPEPQPMNPDGGPIRVMVYNIHGGANPTGQIDMEAIAQVIEREDPHVVGLQEVSRGWVLNGSMDALVWLAQRLDMVPIFGPAADGQWGNAVLTKLPVESFTNEPLPPDDLLLKRAYMTLSLDRGPDQPLTLVNTHYHNPAGGGAIREQQTATILDAWAGTPTTLIMGDMNAEHGKPEIDRYTEEGFSDVLDLTGLEPRYTNPVPGPSRQIDYIFITTDLQATDAVIPPEEASDHLPIAVTIR